MPACLPCNPSSSAREEGLATAQGHCCASATAPIIPYLHLQQPPISSATILGWSSCPLARGSQHGSHLALPQIFLGHQEATAREGEEKESLPSLRQGPHLHLWPALEQVQEGKVPPAGGRQVMAQRWFLGRGPNPASNPRGKPNFRLERTNTRTSPRQQRQDHTHSSAPHSSIMGETPAVAKPTSWTPGTTLVTVFLAQNKDNQRQKMAWWRGRPLGGRRWLLRRSRGRQ